MFVEDAVSFYFLAFVALHNLCIHLDFYASLGRCAVDQYSGFMYDSFGHRTEFRGFPE